MIFTLGVRVHLASLPMGEVYLMNSSKLVGSPSISILQAVNLSLNSFRLSSTQLMSSKAHSTIGNDSNSQMVIIKEKATMELRLPL